MFPREIIRKRRDGEELDRATLAWFFHAYLSGTVTDEQMSAFLMACFFSPLTMPETLAITDIFIRSGSTLDLAAVPGVKVDKHSTGGVGDKTSLLLVPIVAAAGVRVPMISGRGLSHTGGTLDKLESIPGFRTTLSSDAVVRMLAETGMVMAGQSDELVPLDRRIYALRDVTATVEILPLIAASILSKKVACGADALVLDIKTGRGAFMRERAQAEELALLLAGVGRHFGLPTVGLITDMDEPLGLAIGNWLEVVEVIDCLRGRETPDLMEVTYALAGLMIHLGRKAQSVTEGMAIARDVVRRGLAYEKFVELVRSQGGDTSVVEDTLRARNATAVIEVLAPRDGVVRAIDARRLGLLAAELGAGRKRIGDEVDHTAGIVLGKKRGEMVEEEEVLCRLYSSSVGDLALLREEARAAFTISSAEPGGDADFPRAGKIFSYFDEDTIVPWGDALTP
ncbi:MAG: thymidine phosphorylase [Bacteroidota bacterium]|jgi:pyrimidine-nucleoside phosphorylase|nr:thymidine phosphorylase [Bacteroidota bacterium]